MVVYQHARKLIYLPATLTDFNLSVSLSFSQTTNHLWSLLTPTTLPKRRQEMKKKGMVLAYIICGRDSLLNSAIASANRVDLGFIEGGFVVTVACGERKF